MRKLPDRAVLGRVWAEAFAAAAVEGDTSRAAGLVAPVLCDLNPDTAPPDTLLTELAVLWAQCAAREPDVPAAMLRWAEYGVDAAISRHGTGHRVTRRSRMALAGALSRRGEHLHAAELYRLAAEQLPATNEPGEPARWAPALHGAALHAAGRCQAGIDALTQHRRTRGDDRGQTQQHIRHQLVAMLAACERYEEARELLAYTAPGGRSAPSVSNPRQPLATIGAAAPIAEVDPLHALVCERRRPASNPANTGALDGFGDGLHPATRRTDWRELLP